MVRSFGALWMPHTVIGHHGFHAAKIVTKVSESVTSYVLMENLVELGVMRPGSRMYNLAMKE